MSEPNLETLIQGIHSDALTLCEGLCTLHKRLQDLCTQLGETGPETYGMVKALLQAQDPRVARFLEANRIQFSSVLMLDDVALAALLKELDPRLLTLALKGAPEEVQNQFFRNMPSRAVTAMKEEIESMGPVPSKGVHAAREYLVEQIRRMEAAGFLRFNATPNDYIA